MNKDVIEHYDTFDTNRWPDKLIFDSFNDQTIPSNCYNFLNDGNDDGNNSPGNFFENDLPYSKGVEDTVIPKY